METAMTRQIQQTAVEVRTTVSTVIRYASLAIAVAVAASACSQSPTAPSGGGSGAGGGAAATVTSVVVSGNLTLSEGRTTQLTATAMMSDGTQQNVTNSSIWSSSNANVATVSGTGLVTPLLTGTADIAAAYQGRTGRVTAQVAAATFRIDVVVESVTALNTCDDFTQGLSSGEFAVRVLGIETDGMQSSIVNSGSYPGNPDNLRAYQLGKNESRTFNARRTFTVRGADGEFVRLQLNATEWDEQVVVIPPSVRRVPDGDLNNRGASRSHSYANGTFSGLGPNTLTVGNSSCGIRLNYTVSATRQ
jgi:hypothetical protein